MQENSTFPSLQVSGISLPLPPKKLIGNMDREFIAERQRGLQTYLDSITQHPLLSTSLFVKKFLDPNNYSANYSGLLAHFIELCSFLPWFEEAVTFYSTVFIYLTNCSVVFFVILINQMINKGNKALRVCVLYFSLPWIYLFKKEKKYIFNM